MERATRLELATPTLARLCSTTELYPHSVYYKNIFFKMQEKMFASGSRLRIKEEGRLADQSVFFARHVLLYAANLHRENKNAGCHIAD